jgi:hypothetical protein
MRILAAVVYAISGEYSQMDDSLGLLMSSYVAVLIAEPWGNSKTKKHHKHAMEDKKLWLDHTWKEVGMQVSFSCSDFARSAE